MAYSAYSLPYLCSELMPGSSGQVRSVLPEPSTCLADQEAAPCVLFGTV